MARWIDQKIKKASPVSQGGSACRISNHEVCLSVRNARELDGAKPRWLQYVFIPSHKPRTTFTITVQPDRLTDRRVLSTNNPEQPLLAGSTRCHLEKGGSTWHARIPWTSWRSRVRHDGNIHSPPI